MLLGKIWMFQLAQHYLTLFDQKLNSKAFIQCCINAIKQSDDVCVSTVIL